MKLALALALALALVVACGGSDATEIKREPERPRRVIEPPSGRVRALPPHAIRADGVGPYRLGATLVELLAELPSGPRIALFELPGVHRSVLRAENDQILIGGEPLGKATFVAVIGPDVARTESGVHVGSSRDDVTRALGAPLVQLDRARDSRVVVPSGLRSARVVFDGDRGAVAAIVIVADPDTAAAGAGGTDAGCVRPVGDNGRFGACLASGERVEIDGDDLVVRTAETDRPIATPHVPNLVFAAALRTPGDDHDELVAIARVDEPRVRTWALVAFRIDGGKLVRSIEPVPIYQLTASNARVLGADLRDVDLLLELTARTDSIEVGALLVTHNGDKLRDAVAIAQLAAVRRAR